MTGKKPHVYILMPVFNRLRYTKRCLNSIFKQNYKNFTVLLIDDKSSDNTSSFVSKTHPQVLILKGNGNWWWTRSMYEGVNKALLEAKAQDFILTMNNDCYFMDNYLSNIVKASLENNRAIVGSLVLDSENTTTVIDAGIRIKWSSGLIYAVAKQVSNKLSFYKTRRYIYKIDTLPGKGTLIPVEVFKRAGNFNFHRLPHYIADYEFFIRAKRKGFKLVVSTKSILYNYAKATGITHPPNPKLKYAQVLQLLFNRKSRINIVDQFNFLLLVCPKKYLYINLKILFWKIVNNFLKIFPFYYMAPLIFKARVIIHNIPIYLFQTKDKIRLFFTKK